MLIIITSLNHRYTSQALVFSILASLAMSPTGYCLTHQNRAKIHCWSDRRDLEKKLRFLMDFRPLHCLHHQLTPSDTSFLALSSICTLHLCIMYAYTNVLCMHTQMYYACIHKCILGNDHQTYDLIFLVPWTSLCSCKQPIYLQKSDNAIHWAIFHQREWRHSQ